MKTRKGGGGGGRVGSRGLRVLGGGAGGPHLLQLVHSLLQLYPHSVLLFPPGRHGGQGGNVGAESHPAPAAPCSPPLWLRPLPDSRSGALDAPGLWAATSGRPAGGQPQLSGGSTLPGKCESASCLPGTSGTWGRAPGTVFKSNCCHYAPSWRPSPQAPAPPAAWLASSPVLPAPDHQAHQPGPPPSVAQIRSPASCLHQTRAPLARCPASCGAI